MLDLKQLRTNFAAAQAKLATRGVDAAVLDNMKELDEQRGGDKAADTTTAAANYWFKSKKKRLSAIPFLRRLPKPNATRKMLLTRLLPCRL